MGKRRTKRTKAVVPVQLWTDGGKQSYLAHTLDFSNDGVRIGGFRGELATGDKIEIQYRKKRALFRVTWVVQREKSLEKQVGAQCLEPGKQVWGELIPSQPDEFEKEP